MSECQTFSKHLYLSEANRIISKGGGGRPRGLILLALTISLILLSTETRVKREVRQLREELQDPPQLSNDVARALMGKGFNVPLSAPRPNLYDEEARLRKLSSEPLSEFYSQTRSFDKYIPGIPLPPEMKVYNSVPLTLEEKKRVVREYKQAITNGTITPYKLWQPFDAIEHMAGEQQNTDLCPPGFNFTHNPGLARAGEKPHKRLEIIEKSAWEYTRQWKSSTISSEEIEEMIEDGHRSIATDLQNRMRRHPNFSSSEELESESIASEEVYQRARDGFLNDSEWKLAITPRYYVPALDKIGPEAWNKTYHYLSIVQQLRQVTPWENIKELERYRLRIFPQANMVLHHRFQIPENEFYRFLMLNNVTIHQCAHLGANIKDSDELDLLEDLWMVGVDLPVIRRVKKSLREIAEKSVDFFPGEKLPKRATFFDHEEKLGPVRVPEIRTSDDGWWFYYRSRDIVTCKVKTINLQYTTRWRQYEEIFYHHWELANQNKKSQILSEQKYYDSDNDEDRDVYDGLFINQDLGTDLEDPRVPQYQKRAVETEYKDYLRDDLRPDAVNDDTQSDAESYGDSKLESEEEEWKPTLDPELVGGTVGSEDEATADSKFDVDEAYQEYLQEQECAEEEKGWCSSESLEGRDELPHIKDTGNNQWEMI